MSALEEAVERVWPGREARVEVLGGGITNHNLKVDVDGEQYVLRVAGKDTGLLGIDRTVELAATEAAAQAGIGPEVVAFVEPEGWLVTRFFAGATPPVERMREADTLARVAAALRAFHDGPAIPGTFDSFRVVETYRATALERGGRVPKEYEWAHEVAGRIGAKRSANAPVPCHNDLLNANFLDDGERLCIVDWEYAGMGDRFFDLANFSINHELDDDATATLLGAYFGSVRDQTRTGSRSCASCPTSARRCGASCSRPSRSSTSTSTRTRSSTSATSPDCGVGRRSGTRWPERAKGALRRPSRRTVASV